MGRRPRIHFVGAFYHVIARGNNRQALFARSSDFLRFEGLIDEGVRRFGHTVHAYCWMTNHVHMAVEVDTVSLAAIMHNLCTRYSNWQNRRLSHTGHLFERRYRAGLIETRESACRLVRYIHLNPVRAGLAKDPSNYSWSSHRSYVGKTTTAWLETQRILRLFGDSPTGSRRAFVKYVLAGLDEDPEETEVNNLSMLFEDRSKEDTRRVEDDSNRLGPLGPPLWRLAKMSELLETVTIVHGIESSELAGRSQKREVRTARALSAYLAKGCQEVSITELSRSLDRDPSTIHRAAEGLARRLRSSPELKIRIEEICALLTDRVRGRS